MRILIDANVILDALIFYILRKDLSIEDRRIVLLNLCEILEVEGVDSRKVKSALNRGDFKDLEDCIQDECAAAIKADYIVTRNKKDFENSTVPAILPQEFLDMIENR